MAFPTVPGKHGFEAIITAEDLLAHLREHGHLAEETPPPAVVMCYSRRLLRRVLANEGVRAMPWPGQGTLHVLERTGGSVAVVGDFGLGAPATAMVLEGLVACGVTDVVIVGGAGTLQPDCPLGSVVVCNRAIRDEGVSHHYVAPGKYALPSPELTRRLTEAIAAAGLPARSGTTWTTDAPYRETVEEVRQFQREGVITVEMEAAALFSVAQVRGVRAAAAFFVTDSLADLTWRPDFYAPELDTTMHNLLTTVVDVLAS